MLSSYMIDDDALGNSSKPARRIIPDFGGGFKSISRAAISSRAVISAGVIGWTGSAAREGDTQPKPSNRPIRITEGQKDLVKKMGSKRFKSESVGAQRQSSVFSPTRTRKNAVLTPAHSRQRV